MRRALLAALAWFALLAPAAAAHVTISPAAARPGETVALRFTVANEREDSRTVRVQVFLPDGTPARVGRHPGWSGGVTGGQVDLTADSPADAIAGEDSRDFTLTVGPLPQAGRLVFKVLQHYADGEIVRWIQDPAPGAERPAPVLELTATGRPAAGATTDGGGSSAGWAILAAVLVAAMGAGVVLARGRAR